MSEGIGAGAALGTLKELIDNDSKSVVLMDKQVVFHPDGQILFRVYHKQDDLLSYVMLSRQEMRDLIINDEPSITIEGMVVVNKGDDGDGPTKTLNNSNVDQAKKQVSDLKIVGNGDAFQLLFKASSEAEGWMKSTKAMQVTGGCIVQVTTQQRNLDGSYAVAEALTYVPGVRVVEDKNNGRQLTGLGINHG